MKQKHSQTSSDSNSQLDFDLGILQQKIAQLTAAGALHTTAIAGLSLFSATEATELVSRVYPPCICIIAQGAKRVLLGDESFAYDAHNYLITSVNLPTLVQIIEAKPQQPYLGLRLELDLHEVSRLIADSQRPVPRLQSSGRGMSTGVVTPKLLSAFVRLVGLLEDERDIAILSPMIQREIIYYLLISECGSHLRQIASVGSQSQLIAQAIQWLQNNFHQPLRVDDLADQSGMSTSTFHHHFRAMTALSPLQYQKHLRLQEARRLMLANHLDASSAARRVGYESPSQFSREYSRYFGLPPRRDIILLREMETADV